VENESLQHCFLFLLLTLSAPAQTHQDIEQLQVIAQQKR